MWSPSSRRTQKSDCSRLHVEAANKMIQIDTSLDINTHTGPATSKWHLTKFKSQSLCPYKAGFISLQKLNYNPPTVVDGLHAGVMTPTPADDLHSQLLTDCMPAS